MFKKIFNSQKNCIVCEKEINKGKEIKKFSVFFCSPECVAEYEKLLEKTKEDMNLDGCCK